MLLLRPSGVSSGDGKAWTHEDMQKADQCLDWPSGWYYMILRLPRAFRSVMALGGWLGSGQGAAVPETLCDVHGVIHLKCEGGGWRLRCSVAISALNNHHVHIQHDGVYCGVGLKSCSFPTNRVYSAMAALGNPIKQS